MTNSYLEIILKELSKKYGFPLYLCSSTETLTFSDIEDSDIQNQVTNILKADSSHENLVNYFIDENKLFSSFIYISISGNRYKILIGPCHLPELPHSLKSLNNQTIYSNNYVSLRKDFLSFVSVVYTLLKQQAIPQPPNWVTSALTLAEIHKISGKNIQSRRYIDSTMDSIEFEKRYLDAVRRNQGDQIEWMINKVRDTYSAELSSNHVESVKYKCVAIITLLTRISVNTGVTPIQAYSLSDALLPRLEDLTTLKECLYFIKEASYMFMELMNSNIFSDKSDLVKQIISYIDNNIYEKISINDLSNATGRHRTYIATVFKKEMSQTIHAYIQSKKIFEAKYHLLLTGQSCKDIASLLNFSNQSHFIQVFKDSESMTPLEYREKYTLKFMAID